MDIKQLRYFMTIVEMNSFSKAAKHLFVSQSTLSKTMRSLEQELDVQLIYFSGKKMRVTNHGAHLCDMAQNMINQHDAIIDMMRGFQKGVIKLGVPPIIGTCVFPKLLSGFREKYPHIEFVIDQHNAYAVQQMADKELLDAGFTRMPLISESFETIEIHKSNYVIVASAKNPLSAKRTLCYADLREEHFILLDEDYRIYHDMILGCRRAGFEPRVVMRLNHWDLILQLVKVNMGISILPLSLLEMFPDGAIVPIVLSDAVSAWDVVMITPKRQYETAALKMFKDHVREFSASINHSRGFV